MSDFWENLEMPFSAIGDIVGSLIGKDANKDAQSRSYRDTKEFAQKGVQWRVADAQAAGIHPLASLGANVSTPTFNYRDNTDYAGAFGRAGQDIGRAVDAVRSGPERAEARMRDYEMYALTRERAMLENDLLASQIPGEGVYMQAGHPPGLGANRSEDLPVPANPLRDRERSTWRTSDTATAQEIEDEYGDFLAWIYGAGRWLNDWFRYNSELPDFGGQGQPPRMVRPGRGY